MILIDANELKEWVENWLTTNKYYHPYSKSNNIPINELYDILEHMPTIDTDPVIRCKDCVYAKPYNKIWQLPIEDALVCTNFDNEEVDENFFCGCAIKRR